MDQSCGYCSQGHQQKGRLIWHTKLSDGTPLGGIHWGMSLVGNSLFVPLADPNWPITR
jgi:polyvinyl alcohol dehydrogenase (cytochrome)